MRVSKLTWLLVLLMVAKTHGRDVVFQGDLPENRKEIERLASRESFSADSVAARLAADGYIDALVTVSGGKAIINAGRRSYLVRILWLNDSTIQTDMDRPFTKQHVESIIDMRLEELREQGHYYSSATVEKVAQENEAVSVELRLVAGPVLTFGRNAFIGLSRTDPAMIERYLPPDTGQPITEAKLREAERRAEAIPFVRYEPPIIIRPLPGYTDAVLEYRFSEKKPVLISGGAGYVPSAASSFVWNLDLAFQNLFGQGRMVRIRSEKREEDRQVLDIAYRQPVFLIGIGEAGVKVGTRDYRDRFYEFATAIDYSAQLGGSFSAGVGVGWRSVEPSGNEVSFNAFKSSFTIERNSIDMPSNPSSGYRLAWTISFGYRRYSDDTTAVRPDRSSYNETRTSVDAEWYQSLVSALVGHIRASFHGLNTAESLPPLSELYYIGGPGSLRGYRNEQFNAIWTAYGSIEPRLRFTGGYLFVFYDAAYINNRVTGDGGAVITDEFYRNSYGLGVSIVERSRSVKVSIGWNPDLPFDQPRLSLEFTSDI